MPKRLAGETSSITPWWQEGSWESTTKWCPLSLDTWLLLQKGARASSWWVEVNGEVLWEDDQAGHGGGLTHWLRWTMDLRQLMIHLNCQLFMCWAFHFPVVTLEPSGKWWWADEGKHPGSIDLCWSRWQSCICSLPALLGRLDQSYR